MLPFLKIFDDIRKKWKSDSEYYLLLESIYYKEKKLLKASLFRFSIIPFQHFFLK